ncbi:ParB family chromosome partitioning protein [Pararhizobium capsulatum DSM 1112]|uniref:ParB family chromosome partitioning protein n=1 Tax=Pararhizobium capsulatum DSM 1112 TaxID=1121113 RepID=A0ABU0BVZ9_9HYPH|nr:plasmid partitioning protein RepB [Pararhizobium capsulatum]MDQ0322127.1 ParB family chromosome partitioning protein [Pararhizobium capsulatum DSM 1112]
MARKNILSGLMDDSKKFTAVNSEAPAEAQALSFKGIGALGAVTRSIDALSARAESAKQLEEKLANGETVIDLDPALIENSFVNDRLGGDDERFQELVEAIRQRGQDSPILVRPHPILSGRYQIAFGHRRARAARVLSRPVRAVVKALDDRDHVIAQGQENSARADLSFIERTMFAHRLEGLSFDRETIMTALSADKTTVSKMLSVTRRIPADVLAALEAARSVGRDRWHDLSALFDDGAFVETARALLASSAFLDADPDRRFELVEALTKREPSPAKPAKVSRAARAWQNSAGTLTAKIVDDGKQVTFALRSDKISAFGAYLTENLERMYEAFEKDAFRSRPSGVASERV